MAFFGYNDYSVSPTMFYPSQQHPFARPPFDRSCASFSMPRSSQSRFPPLNPDPSMEPVAPIPSRKRSRDDDDDGLPTEPSFKPSQKPIYGEGMTLIDPLSGHATTAETQTGTWFEDHLELERLASARATEALAESQTDSIQPSRVKKQCKGSCSVLKPLELSKASTPNQSSPSVATGIDPAIKALRESLGTGWQALSGDMAVRAGSRGWARFIERHYPAMTDVEVVLQLQLSKAYLVRTNQGFFLFSEDLKKGQLSAQTWEAAIANLSTVPNVFEGTEILEAESSPSSSPAETSSEAVHGLAPILSPAAMDID